MSRWAGALWWASAVTLMPLMLPLALHTRRTALRLPPAAGPEQGVAGAGFAGEPLRLLVIGESTVAGVGVDLLERALPGQLANALSLRLERPVAWRACGENGITAVEACERLLPQVADEAPDLVVMAFGVNDTTHFTSRSRWRQALEGLGRPFLQRGACVAFSAVPPLGHFRALPWPLRLLLGWRARLMDRVLAETTSPMGALHCTATLAMRPDYLAIDGYHPSELGCEVWAGLLADRLWLEMVPQPPLAAAAG